MAKKYKRSSRSSAIPRQAAPEKIEGPVSAQPAASAFTRRSAEFNPDYTYVIRDLKRIGILAGTFFVILVGLSFILN